jgi:MFS family permease
VPARRFQIGCALAPNTAAIMLFRFLSGAFAACPLTNAGGVISDIWDADRRGIALAFFSLAPFAGPALGPMIGGYMATAGVPWPDLFWYARSFHTLLPLRGPRSLTASVAGTARNSNRVLFAFAGACFFAILFTVPETYAPKLLVDKARQRRKATGEPRWWAPLERQSVRWQDRVQNILVKPFSMLLLEPMVGPEVFSSEGPRARWADGLVFSFSSSQ